ILLFAFCATVLFQISLWPLILQIVIWFPIIFWESIAHSICLLIIYHARIYDVGTSRRDYIALTGCILWAPVWLWSFARRDPTSDTVKLLATRVLAAIYA